MATAGLTGEGLGEPGSAHSGGSGPVAAQSGPGMGSAGLCGGRVLGRRRGGGGGDVAAPGWPGRRLRWRRSLWAGDKWQRGSGAARILRRGEARGRWRGLGCPKWTRGVHI